MASPFSGLVMASGAVLASPALYAALVEETLSLETALVRFVIAMVVSWIGYSLLESLMSQTSAADRRTDEVPLALPGVDGPIPVRAAVIDPPTEPAQQE